MFTQTLIAVHADVGDIIDCSRVDGQKGCAPVETEEFKPRNTPPSGVDVLKKKKKLRRRPRIC